jgi:hypothetical protein
MQIEASQDQQAASSAMDSHTSKIIRRCSDTAMLATKDFAKLPATQRASSAGNPAKPASRVRRCASHRRPLQRCDKGRPTKGAHAMEHTSELNAAQARNHHTFPATARTCSTTTLFHACKTSVRPSTVPEKNLASDVSGDYQSRSRQRHHPRQPDAGLCSRWQFISPTQPRRAGEG